MKLLALFIISVLVFQHTAAQRLIIRGDDMGYAHAGNEAIIRCAREGIQSSIEAQAVSLD